MSGIEFNQHGLDRRIDSFIDRKFAELPDVRDKSVDEMIYDLSGPDRKSHF